MLTIGAACAACCALPLAAGLGVFAAAGSAAYTGGAAGIALAAGAGVLVWLGVRRLKAPVPAATDQPAATCGCSSASPNVDEATKKAIACTLPADDLKSRVAWTSSIAERHLRKSTRSPLTLHLVYAAKAEPYVREMVRKEQECCAFLRFDLTARGDEIHLLITAPEAARGAADNLFAHFAPELASARGP
jgi:hypothetical protein